MLICIYNACFLFSCAWNCGLALQRLSTEDVGCSVWEPCFCHPLAQPGPQLTRQPRYTEVTFLTVAAFNLKFSSGERTSRGSSLQNQMFIFLMSAQDVCLVHLFTDEARGNLLAFSSVGWNWDGTRITQHQDQDNPQTLLSADSCRSYFLSTKLNSPNVSPVRRKHAHFLWSQIIWLASLLSVKELWDAQCRHLQGQDLQKSAACTKTISTVLFYFEVNCPFKKIPIISVNWLKKSQRWQRMEVRCLMSDF